MGISKCGKLIGVVRLFKPAKADTESREHRFLIAFFKPKTANVNSPDQSFCRPKKANTDGQ